MCGLEVVQSNIAEPKMNDKEQVVKIADSFAMSDNKVSNTREEIRDSMHHRGGGDDGPFVLETGGILRSFRSVLGNLWVSSL